MIEQDEGELARAEADDEEEARPQAGGNRNGGSVAMVSTALNFHTELFGGR